MKGFFLVSEEKKIQNNPLKNETTLQAEENVSEAKWKCKKTKQMLHRMMDVIYEGRQSFQ